MFDQTLGGKKMRGNAGEALLLFCLEAFVQNINGEQFHNVLH